MREPHLILGLGELLWDVLPEGPRLGGAPANFAVMAGQLGRSRRDSEPHRARRSGRKAMDAGPAARRCQLAAGGPGARDGPRDGQFEGGAAAFTHSPAGGVGFSGAYRRVGATGRAGRCALLRVAGAALPGVAADHPDARGADPSSCMRVFDVNLRAPFYSGEVIQESLELATVIKMSDAEVPLVLGLLGLPAGARIAEAGATAPGARSGCWRSFRRWAWWL